MTETDEGADRVAHGEASLGDAQSHNPPEDPEMLADDAGELDTDVDFHGELPEEEERDEEDPAPNAP